jgi:hypothetical protein
MFVRIVATAVSAEIARYMNLNAHAAHSHYVNNQILFDDPEQVKTMQDLTSRLCSAEQ